MDAYEYFAVSYLLEPIDRCGLKRWVIIRFSPSKPAKSRIHFGIARVTIVNICCSTLLPYEREKIRAGTGLGSSFDWRLALASQFSISPPSPPFLFLQVSQTSLLSSLIDITLCTVVHLLQHCRPYSVQQQFRSARDDSSIKRHTHVVSCKNDASNPWSECTR